MNCVGIFNAAMNVVGIFNAAMNAGGRLPVGFILDNDMVLGYSTVP